MAALAVSNFILSGCQMRIIDTHLHLIYLDKFSYPWLEGVPALNRQWDVESYFAEAAPLGIDSALHMEVDVLERQAVDETAFVLDNLHPRIEGAIAQAHPEHFDFPKHLDQLLALGRVRGIRRLLQSDPDELSESDFFRANVRRLAPLRLTFDLCVQSRQLPVARALAAACPDVQFVLDHCGNPLIDSGDIAQWRIDLASLAELPNVAGKISGIVNHAPPDWTPETLRPAIEHMIRCFGWDRVVWGSDRPVCVPNSGLTRWVEATRAIVAGASQSEQESLFFRNAERIYRA
ncbi:MAG TPA: amidohydrolase family protein [Devosia sp.]|nr:amidohydrolase family protein [Devosia sp.]